jgi:glycosyltransferase involved in cell wall biosynthesis
MNRARSARKALFWSYDPEEPSFRHRMLSARDQLADRGWQCIVETLPKGRYLTRILERREQLRSAAVVVLHRIKLTPIEFRPLRAFCRTLVFDVDDAIYYRRPRQLGEAPDKSWFRPYKFARTCAISDLVMAGNRCLADRAGRSTERVEIVPTPVDLSQYEALYVERSPHTLVWIGLPENLPYLELVRGVIGRLADDYPDLVLRVVSAEFPNWPEVKIEQARWSSASEATDLATAGIGIMPLTDDEWTHGKCAFKLLQYMAAALPCVGSAVGANLEVVDEGRTGFLAADPAAWSAALSRLLSDRHRASAMGRAGRDRVRKHYDTRVVSSRAADLIEEVADSHL